MSELTREQFATAVSATLTSVHHLYREIHRLVGGLKEQLGEAPDPMILFGGTVARSGRDQGRLVVRNEYALLFKPSGDDEEEADDDDEESDDEGDAAAPKRKRKPAMFSNADMFLGVVVTVYDPRGPEKFEPRLSYGAMNSWFVGGKPLAPNSKISVSRYMLRRIPRAITQPGVGPGDRVPTTASVKSVEGLKKVSDRRLSCALPFGVKTIPLYELESAASLQSAADAMKKMLHRGGIEGPR